MTPTVTDLLNGCILTLATPPRPEDAGLFAGARIRLAAMMNKLVALECADGAAVRVWENAALRALIATARPKHGVPASELEQTADGDYSLRSLDAANAKLRRLLIRLHEAAESSGDAELDRNILKLYREIARRRELYLPPMKPMA
jgi:hypothetical protein